jgi:hypothetical protein
MDHRRNAAIVALVVVLLSARATRADDMDFPMSSDFDILNGDGSELVGHAHYDFTPTGRGSYRLRGENRFHDGEYDVEVDEIRASRPPGLATMTTYRHDYFATDGALERVAAADVGTGEGSCTTYEAGRPEARISKIEFPSDTYAGSTVLIPLVHHLRRGFSGPILFHNFNCVPGPKLLTIKAYPPARAAWSHHPGELVAVRIKPDFGWLNALIAPFIPRMDAWFEPRRNWAYVGGKSGRFYRGPEIILVDLADGDGRARLREAGAR